uniref:ADP,ATP carrier protein n=1 Tax=Mantoniella antarctica TaxID=81844 RepID=A0A7S0SKU5_9CHLO|mmetsp:Transcript_27285/g.68311  ORF Transcript_27285/g.68311 Transcript_27285/m.68311 type:complete len:112 (+) Transcript_27285:80-415(+)
MSSAKDDAPAWAHALAGQVAGMVGLSVVHPIDTVKCRVQATVGRPGVPPVSGVALASQLVRRDGLLALYRGIGAPMVAYGMINAVAFSTNTAVVRYLRDGGGDGVSASWGR